MKKMLTTIRVTLGDLHTPSGKPFGFLRFARTGRSVFVPPRQLRVLSMFLRERGVAHVSIIKGRKGPEVGLVYPTSHYSYEFNESDRKALIELYEGGGFSASMQDAPAPHTDEPGWHIHAALFFGLGWMIQAKATGSNPGAMADGEAIYGPDGQFLGESGWLCD